MLLWVLISVLLVTAWIVSMGEWSAFLKPEIIAPLLVGIAAFVILFSSKNKKRANIGEILMGFGLLFMGLSVMSSAIEPYQNQNICRCFCSIRQTSFSWCLVGRLLQHLFKVHQLRLESTNLSNEYDSGMEFGYIYYIGTKHWDMHNCVIS